jgi:1-acyl-sn-glycerol-3-phosphate acyltransferase
MIFPEGRRTVRGEGKVYRGVEELAHSHPHAMVVPVHIEWRVRWKYIRSFRIAIGAPFDASQLTAQDIMDRIYALPVR